MKIMKALIFDCDGVLVDTEKDGHRVAFNRAFAQKGYDFQWDVGLYGELLNVAGGKERMRHYFEKRGWPVDVTDREDFIKKMHRLKTENFMEIIESGQIPLRPGIKRIVDEAINDNIILAVCSTSNEKAVNLIVEKLLGAERKKHFKAILAGDVVSKKKPDPEIYNLVKDRLGLKGNECMVVEDSQNGLLAAKGAGMHCIITISGYTGNEDFSEADVVFDDLGNEPSTRVTLRTLEKIINIKRQEENAKL